MPHIYVSRNEQRTPRRWERRKMTKTLSREYLEAKIAKARDAISFAVPGADLSYAKATLIFAQIKLDALDKQNA
jgi:hypothetical protein